MRYLLGISALCFRELVGHVRQYICANTNKLRCMAFYISMVNNLGGFARESEINYMGFLYPYNSHVGQIRRLFEPPLHNISDPQIRVEVHSLFHSLLNSPILTMTLYFRQNQALWLAR